MFFSIKYSISSIVARIGTLLPHTEPNINMPVRTRTHSILRASDSATLPWVPNRKLRFKSGVDSEITDGHSVIQTPRLARIKRPFETMAHSLRHGIPDGFFGGGTYSAASAWGRANIATGFSDGHWTGIVGIKFIDDATGDEIILTTDNLDEEPEDPANARPDGKNLYFFTLAGDYNVPQYHFWVPEGQVDPITKRDPAWFTQEVERLVQQDKAKEKADAEARGAKYRDPLEEILKRGMGKKDTGSKDNGNPQHEETLQPKVGYMAKCLNWSKDTMNASVIPLIGTKRSASAPTDDRPAKRVRVSSPNIPNSGPATVAHHKAKKASTLPLPKKGILKPPSTQLSSMSTIHENTVPSQPGSWFAKPTPQDNSGTLNKPKLKPKDRPNPFTDSEKKNQFIRYRRMFEKHIAVDGREHVLDEAEALDPAVSSIRNGGTGLSVPTYDLRHTWVTTEDNPVPESNANTVAYKLASLAVGLRPIVPITDNTLDWDSDYDSADSGVDLSMGFNKGKGPLFKGDTNHLLKDESKDDNAQRPNRKRVRFAEPEHYLASDEEVLGPPAPKRQKTDDEPVVQKKVGESILKKSGTSSAVQKQRKEPASQETGRKPSARRIAMARAAAKKREESIALREAKQKARKAKKNLFLQARASSPPATQGSGNVWDRSGAPSPEVQER